MLSLKEYKKQFPLYKDIPDEELAKSLHTKFYSEIPFEQFQRSVTSTPEITEQPSEVDEFEVVAAGAPSAVPIPEPTGEESEVSKAAKRGVPGAKAGIARGIEFLGAQIQQGEDPTRKNLFDSVILPEGKGVREFGARVAEEFEAEAAAPELAPSEEFLDKPWYAPERLAATTVETAPLTVAAVGTGVLATVITKNPFVGSTISGTIFGVTSAGEIFKEAKDAGISEEEALQAARLAGAGEAALEFIPGMMFMKLLGGGKQLKKTVLKEGFRELRRAGRVARAAGKIALAESLEEGSQTVKNNLIARKFYDSERALLKDVPESAAIGGILGLGLGGAGGVVNTVQRERMLKKIKKELEGIPETLLDTDAREAAIEDIDQQLEGPTSVQKILTALEDTESLAVLEQGGITEEADQIEAIVADKVKQKADAAIALNRRGETNLAEKTKQEALDAAQKIIEVGGEEVTAEVHRALGLTRDVQEEVDVVVLPDKTLAVEGEFRDGAVVRSLSDQAASPEAISRIKSEKAAGIERVKVDTRSQKEIPLIGVDAVDVQPGPFDVIVQREPGKADVVLSRGERAKAYLGNLARDERGVLFPKEPDENFTTDGAQEVEKMFDDSEVLSHKGRSLKGLHKVLGKAFVDNDGNLQEALGKWGALGQRVRMMKDLIAGASAKGDHILEEFKDRVYKGLSPKERKYLDRYLTSIRILTIEKYKPINQPRGLKKEHVEWLQQLSPELKTKLAERGKRYFAATRWVLDDQLKEGLIDEATHKRMAVKGPFQTRRFLEHVDPMSYKSFEGGKQISVGESGNKALKEGSEGLLDTDSELLLSELISRHVNRTFRNNASKMLLELTEETDADFVKLWSDKKAPKGWKKIFAMVDGKRRTIVMKEQLANEWVVRDPLISEGTAKFLRWTTGTSLLKAMATGLNPEFAITNPFRDIALVWAADYNGAYSKILPKFLLEMGHDLATVTKDAVKREGRYKDALNDGGMMDFLVIQGRLFGSRHRIMNKLQKYAGWLGETSEIMVRLALRERHLRNGATPQEATWAARNYLDFSKGGSLAKAMDNAIPYFNASIQGTRSMVRSAKINPKDFAIKMSQVVALSMGLFLANRYENPEATEDVSPHDRVNNWIFTSDYYFYDKDGNKKYLYFKVAKDQGQRVFAAIGENAARALIGEKVHLDEVVQASQEFLNLQGSGLLPPPVKAILGYTSNYDFWRNEEIWRGPEIKAKNEFTRYTSPALKDAGAITGMSPKRLGFALSQFFTSGNIYTSTVSHTYNRITDQMTDRDKDLVMEEILTRKPGIRRAMSATDPFHKFQKGLEEAKLEAVTDRFDLNQRFDEVVQDVLREDKPKQAINDFLKTQDFSDRKRLRRRFKRSRKLFRQPDMRWWLNLAEMPAGARAVVYFQRWQQASPEEKQRLKKQRFKIPGINSQEFRRELFKTKKSLTLKK